MFKTQKQLGGRAIVSDAWTRTPMKTPAADDIGDGWEGHRDGYNVLYGDWSAKFQGDPQQRWIWAWAWGRNTTFMGNTYSELNTTPGQSTRATNSHTYDALDDGWIAWRYTGAVGWSATDKWLNDNSPWGTWHWCDVANGIDVGNQPHDGTSF